MMPDDVRPARESQASARARGSRYDGVLLVLLALVVVGCAGALASVYIAPVVLDAFVALLLAALVIYGVRRALAMRAGLSEPAAGPPPDAGGGAAGSPHGRPPGRDAAPESASPADLPGSEEPREAIAEGPPPGETPPSVAEAGGAGPADAAASDSPEGETRSGPALSPLRWFGHRPAAASPLRSLEALRSWIASAVLLSAALDVPLSRNLLLPAGVFERACVLTGCLLAAGGAALTARYLAGVDTTDLPEARGLCRGARVVAWLLLLSGVSVAVAWAGSWTAAWIVRLIVLGVIASLCFEMRSSRPSRAAADVFDLDLDVLAVLGSRPNALASLLDALDRQLGIDLRSTWALDVLRRSAVPLGLGFVAVTWLSTSFSVVGLDECALIERLGVPVGPGALDPGLHLHWPWPIDRVTRIAVARVRSLKIGHAGGGEEPGPEDVLWARSHAETEYTLLLGNGRDLIAIDATVQFRITDPWAWRYNTENPTDALRAIAYRAVMRATVNRTLADTLSENVAKLSAQMGGTVQREADALGLGVDVVTFTIGGMHPPVAVASAYQGVVSAQLGRVTAAAQAQSDRIRVLSSAAAYAVVAENGARAEAAGDLARAAGEAWSFRTLQAQVHAEPGAYRFRRRLETLEQGLSNRPYTVIDARILRDGGGLWLQP